MYFRLNFLLPVSILIFVLSSCSQQPELGNAPMPDNYHEEFQEWSDYRIGVLSDSTGWLRMIDLQWLSEGENSFGSASNNDIVFPEGKIADYAGTFLLENSVIIMNVADNVEVTHNLEPVNELVILDNEDNRPRVQHGDLIWFSDVRDDQYGIRLYSLDTPKADEFDGFPRYDISEEWHKQARFIPHEEPQTMLVDDVIDRQREVTSPGKLEFSIDGELYTLDAIESSGRFFIMFADHTNEDETYQAGRYMLVPQPENDDESVILDFNKAYNPPCAFSKFTTCQLPPPQNRLDVAIEAGEKRPVNFEGL